MKPATWRAGAFVCIGAAIAFVLYQFTLPDRDNFGIHFNVPRARPGVVRVVSIEPGSPAAKAGIRAGDTISYGEDAFQRATVLFARPGQRVSLVVNGSRTVTFTARYIPQRDLPWIPTAVRLAFLVIAGLLAWRRPADGATRWLVVFLWCYGLAIAMANGTLATPLLSLIVMQILYLGLFFVGTAAVAAFAARFPGNAARPLPLALSRVTLALSFAAAAGFAAAQLLTRTATAASILSALFLATFIAIGLLVFATLVTAYIQGGIAERQRRRWIFLLIAVGLAGPLIDVAVQALFGLNAIIDEFSLLPLGILPVGLAYVILRHRMIDVGFVINRALVYTCVSFIVVGIFVIAETLLSTYVERTNHVESLSLQLALALALGFSIRAIHARVDRFVDATLFRERHAADAALHAFAHDASYITDRDALLNQTVDIVERCAGVRGAAVWVHVPPSYYAQAAGTFDSGRLVGENDPAILAMRARRVCVHVPEAGSDLPGWLALPMVVRGELIGILLCGPKTGDETFAPDERETLASLAAAVGHALDALEVRELRRRLRESGATAGAQAAF